MLTAFGANPSHALAADQVWRAATYLAPILTGAGTYLICKRGVAKGRYADAPDTGAAADPASMEA